MKSVLRKEKCFKERKESVEGEEGKHLRKRKEKRLRKGSV